MVLLHLEGYLLPNEISHIHAIKIFYVTMLVTSLVGELCPIGYFVIKSLDLKSCSPSYPMEDFLD